MTDTLSRIRGCLLGLAAGDAVGTTVEFRPRGSFPPVTDMTGGGPFRLPVGAWTDDTSMALCLGTSLVEKNGFDANDQMTRYTNWREKGYLSSTGGCFDIGNTTAAALHRYRTTGDPFAGSTHPNAAGNGSIMRLAPVPLFYHRDAAAAGHYSAESSRTTHASPECVDACRLLAGMIVTAVSGAGKDAVLFGQDPESFAAAKVRNIARGAYRMKSDDEISGTGYVIDSLEAAAWAVWKTDDYRDAVLLAVNLGDDADTTAAVCGQIAGALYGEAAIPADWRAKLVMHAEICDLADRLAAGPV